MGRESKLLWAAFAVGILGGAVACGAASPAEPLVAQPAVAPTDGPASGPASAVPTSSPSVLERAAVPTSSPSVLERPALPDGKTCEDFRSGTCPESCGQRCVGSCPTCDDCGGKGSCYTL